MMRRRLFGTAFAVALVAAFFGAGFRVTPLWGLYVMDPAVKDREVLFLDPFPSAGSCADAARAVGTSGQWTRCRGRFSLSFFQPARLLAFERQFAPGGLWEHEMNLCGFIARPRGSHEVSGAAGRRVVRGDS